ncbi:UDP-N-acetylmuramoyl-L-alanyl-D-glutamate--2,6-diaminopimelate ligase [Candidatus Magnetobacterium casense]|uniref:UDP-N-acetylmuramoyl-L-alanyl-D-glutamate--2,6-diaminopimelate ligase n=1 Tax=Candidatus Magnetobacterium casense TaxID=1455061 RepID=A0ABS6RVW2_9BACT|nr:UDP-N-acetylmuramoyl-L-alanyl-D-glutamate--2,6-diaminopimelate ligase [Candidatus Magnetobacterium casensis]MBV6340768.1 UDP-N-acetylmuramoyl-L-alanyl-D-glutamate--2,6-diaminopimelate ligase [Candidatus Magnetobacterium casensis]
MDIITVLDNIHRVSDPGLITQYTGNLSGQVSDISCDSRRIEQGGMFFAVRGVHSDGHAFIPDAIKRGARWIVYDSDISPELLNTSDVIMLRVADVPLAMAHIAANYYGNPARAMKLIGITGTNGKTTTSCLIKSILQAYDKKTGLIGTIHHMVGNNTYSSSHTTPQAPEFQMFLKRMCDDGCQYVVSEVSSHALAQKRVDAVAFDAAVFTNLTRDHLDYHTNMEDYFNSKKRLFTELLNPKATAIINTDDIYGITLCRHLRELKRTTLSYGITTKADIMASDVEKTLTGLAFKLRCNAETYLVRSHLRGYINVYNILAAFAATLSLAIPVDVILRGISLLQGVRGRLEPIERGQDFAVFIDYAHTNDALDNLLSGVRRFYKGRIITVFGCGGNRDTGKRPMMGRIATTMSNFTIITNDNPRHEDPMDIIAQIKSGVVGNQYEIEPDRREAIKRGIYMAGAGDVVLIAGKGHETYQEVRGVRYPFDDREVAQAFIDERLGGNGVANPASGCNKMETILE